MISVVALSFAAAFGQGAAVIPKGNAVSWTSKSVGWAYSSVDKNQRVMRTADGGKTWIVAFSGNASAGSAASGQLISAPTDREAYFAFVAGDSWRIRRTSDAGAHWSAVDLPASLSKRPTSRAFLSFSDSSHGMLLLCSDPAAGLMQKTVVYTSNSGRTWKAQSEKLSARHRDKNTLPELGYPTGLTLRSANEAWETQLYRSDAVSVPIWHSGDAGVTWKAQSISWPAECKAAAYANVYAPTFSGKDRKDGLLVVEFVWSTKASISLKIAYASNDGGSHWKAIGKVIRENGPDLELEGLKPPPPKHL